MADEGFDDEWDGDFTEEIVLAMERATSALSTQHPPPSLPSYLIPPPSQPPPPHRRLPPPPELSYSPPRELSQRPQEAHHTADIPDSLDSFAPHGADIAKETELSRLQVKIRLSMQSFSQEQYEALICFCL